MDNKNNQQKLNKKAKRKQFWNYGLLFFGLFGVTATTSYFLIPSKKATVGGGDSVPDTPSSSSDNMTAEQHFTSSLMAIKGLDAKVNSFTANIPNPKDAANPEVFSLKDTSVALVMNGWPDISFDVDTTVVFNGVSKDVNISLADSNLYLSALGIKYKTTSENMDKLFDKIYTLAASAGIDSLDLSGAVDTSKATSLLSNLTSSGNTTDGFVYTLPLDDAKTQNIILKSDGNYNLTGVSASALTLNGITMSFDVSVDLNATVDMTSFIPTDSASYLDIYNSWDMIQQVADLIMKPTFGLNMDIAMTKTVTENSVAKTYQVASITGNANMDVKAMNFQGGLTVKAPNEKTLLSDYAALSADKITTQSVAANYVQTGTSDAKDGVVYAAYNDAFKVKMTTSVMDALIAKIKADFPAKDTANSNTLFSFVTESTVMKALAKGQYEAVVNMLDSITTTDNQIVATVLLKDLGLGSSSKVVVTLDGNSKAASLAKIEISGVEMSNYAMSATFALASYTTPSLVETDYQTLDKLPNIYDQVYAISQDTKAGATLSGSVMGYDSTSKAATTSGVSFKGSTEFDANQDLTKDAKGKSGTGSLELTQLKEGKDYQTHYVGIDVRGTDKMLFRYTSSASAKKDYLNGKFTIDTLNDIIALVKKLMASTDKRYTKFFDALTETTATTVVGQIMAKDYETLLRNKILTKLDVYGDSIDLVIDKKLLGSTTDIAVSIGLDTASKVSSVAITDFAISGQMINAKIELAAYDEGKLSTLPDNVTYLDFSQIEVLMQFGITTSELNYFHITATAGVNIGSLIAVNPTLDFYISVDGETVKVVGYIHKIPLIMGVNGSHYKNLFGWGGTREVTFYYQTGYCYLSGSDDYAGTLLDETDHVKVKDTYFAKNILHYLCNNILELSSSIQSQIDTSSSSTSSDPIKFEDVLKAFTYTNTSGTSPIWDLTLDAGVLANDSKLKDLVLKITGTDSDSTDGALDGYLTKMNVTFNMTAIVNITITLDAQLVDIGTDYTSFFNTTWQNYINSHASDSVEGA